MLNTNADLINAIKANTEAFMAISKIAFSSIEQLTTLNLNTTRSSLEDGATAAAALLESNGVTPSSDKKQAASMAATERAATYFQSVQDIASEAQKETTKLINTYLAAQGNGSSHPVSWIKGFDAFNGIGQQLSAMTEANRKVMSDVTSRVVNQTNENARKVA